MIIYWNLKNPTDINSEKRLLSSGSSHVPVIGLISSETLVYNATPLGETTFFDGLEGTRSRLVMPFPVLDETYARACLAASFMHVSIPWGYYPKNNGY
jgi:hypothetical protein